MQVDTFSRLALVYPCYVDRTVYFEQKQVPSILEGTPSIVDLSTA